MQSHFESRTNDIYFDTCSKGKKNSSSKPQKAKAKDFFKFNCIEKKIMHEKGIGLFVIGETNMLYEAHQGKANLFLSNRVSKRLDSVFEKTFVTQTSPKYLLRQTLVFPDPIPPIKIP